MNKTNYLLLITAIFAVAGCSTVSDTKPPVANVKPAPVKKNLPLKPQASKPAPSPVRKSVPGTATYAIEPATNNFKLEPSVPAIKAEPLTPSPESSSNTTVTPGTPNVAITPVAPVITPTVPAMAAVAVEDVRIPTGTQPAVLALLSESDRNRGAGDLDSAVVSLERALRIDSRNPTLTYKLAHLRLKQNKPQLAEELASKAALLAGNDLDLKRKSWLLIAEARRVQQNIPGAKEAKAKAESFFGR